MSPQIRGGGNHGVKNEQVVLKKMIKMPTNGKSVSLSAYITARTPSTRKTLGTLSAPSLATKQAAHVCPVSQRGMLSKIFFIILCYFSSLWGALALSSRSQLLALLLVEVTCPDTPPPKCTRVPVSGRHPQSKWQGSLAAALIAPHSAFTTRIPIYRAPFLSPRALWSSQTEETGSGLLSFG